MPAGALTSSCCVATAVRLRALICHVERKSALSGVERVETSLTIREHSEDLSTPNAQRSTSNAQLAQFPVRRSMLACPELCRMGSVFGVCFRIAGLGELHCERLADWLNSAFNSIALCLVV